MTTAHINANTNDFAETVIFPGDPLRAQNLADKYLTNVKNINEVRNMLAFTGFYKDKKISSKVQILSSTILQVALRGLCLV